MNNIYLCSFPGENVALNARESFKKSFLEITAEKSRKTQVKKLVDLYFFNKQIELKYKYLSKRCSDLDLITHCRNIREKGNTSLKKFEKEFQRGGDLSEILGLVRDYYLKKSLMEMIKNYSLRETIKTLTGVVFSDEDHSKFESIVNDHIKSRGTEVTLKYATEKHDILYVIAQKYDFTASPKRLRLIEIFAEAIKTRSKKKIDLIYDDYQKLIQKNDELVKKFSGKSVMKYTGNA